ncbi:MAG: hypothetical protein RIC89_00335 [Pseudomonadales bacterium]
MKLRNAKALLTVSLLALTLIGEVQAQAAAAEPSDQAPAKSQQQPTPKQIAQHKAAQAKKARQDMLQRMYNMRIRLEQERAAAENQARANVRLATQDNYRHIDAPTVSGLRQQTNVQLSKFEQMFRCLDVDVEDNSGNTVVICGDNHGDISGRNVSAERDIVTYPGGRP